MNQSYGQKKREQKKGPKNSPHFFKFHWRVLDVFLGEISRPGPHLLPWRMLAENAQKACPPGMAQGPDIIEGQTLELQISELILRYPEK